MKKPNVVFILADDMGYGDFGIFGDGSSKTPNLDRLVEEGTTLTQHYSASPVCAPSRAAFMTGRYPHRTGVIDTIEALGTDRLSLGETTIADVFRQKGYTTGLVGKWHLGAIDPGYHPNNRGFDEFIGFRGGWSDYYLWRIEHNGHMRASDGTYLTDVWTNEAVGFIKKYKDQPFYLHVAYNAPHTPIQAPEEFIQAFRDTGKFNETLSTLYAMIHVMDKGIGSILDTLKEFGLKENTLVIFTSDNGPTLHGNKARYNCHFRGQKCFTYEGGIKVPAVMRWPCQFPTDTRIHQFVHATDWFPTLLAACGMAIPENLAIDGQNVLDLFKGTQKPYGRQRCWQWNRYDPVLNSNAAIREGKWKLVRPAIMESFRLSQEDVAANKYLMQHVDEVKEIKPPSYTRQLPPPFPPELYNIEDDPFEMNNLAGKMPELTERLSRDLEDWFSEVEAERKENIHCTSF